MIRPRRLRTSSALRDLVEETKIHADDFIYPVFVKDSISAPEEIKSMPGIFRHSLDSVLKEVESAYKLGIKAIAVFPVLDSSLKTLNAEESYNPKGLMQRAIRAIKSRFPEILLVSDIALDPYTEHGHDGLLGANGEILNDPTVELLCRMALVQAEAGADIVAPSDMMDGRVRAIRESLNTHGYQSISIMAYSAKYASCLYGPFREALGSLGSEDLSRNRSELGLLAPKTAVYSGVPKDKKTYQMNPANVIEAMRELELDLMEGADFVMVKPAGWYLDVISRFKNRSPVPVVAYQVSGEYSMIHSASAYIDLDMAIRESLLSIKRAGADLILSYFAKDFLS